VGFQCGFDDAGAGNAHVKAGLPFARPVKGPCHERVVFRRVAEDHELGAAKAVARCGLFGGLFNDIPHQSYRVHVDAALCAGNVHRRAHPLRLRQGFGNGSDKPLVPG